MIIGLSAFTEKQEMNLIEVIEIFLALNSFVKLQISPKPHVNRLAVAIGTSVSAGHRSERTIVIRPSQTSLIQTSQ